MQVSKSNKLANVCYDIRGPVLKHAKRLEDEGHRILKLNIGNPAPFGFEAPEEILQDVIRNLPISQGYSDSKGLFSARKAVMQYCQQKNIEGVTIEDIYLGNGVSELIVMALQALLNNGDEVLIPAPDYPLWTAATSLAGGKAVHYLCDEQSDWYPDIADIKAKITRNTRAILLINPNNPTGAVYPKEVLEEIIEVARQHNLVIFSDEKNPGRKKPFDIRKVMRSVTDQDHQPLERWPAMRDAENAVIWDAHIGGYPVAMIGLESRALPRRGWVPADGPEQWTSGTLFPMASKKVARAINACSGSR